MKKLVWFALLACCVVCACERGDKAPEPADDKPASTAPADPEFSNDDLEHQLDRIESEIKAGASAGAAADTTADHAAGRAAPDEEKAGRRARRKPNDPRTKESTSKGQAAGNGSS